MEQTHQEQATATHRRRSALPVRGLSYLLLISPFLPAVAQQAQPAANPTTSQVRVTCCFHMLRMQGRENEVGYYAPAAFLLRSKDAAGNTTWSSDRITSYEPDDSGYTISVSLPEKTVLQSKDIWCYATYPRAVGEDTVRYGGVPMMKIKLDLRSQPDSAEVFIMSARTWDKRFEPLHLALDSLDLSDYRINDGHTNTHVFVDETVFVILFKRNGRIKKIFHHTRPYEVEKVQVVSADF